MVLIQFSMLQVGFAQEETSEAFLDSLKRSTPSGQYIDPASFFRFHGYVSLSLANPQDDLGTENGRTPQILISGLSSRTGHNEGGFKNDAALFIGGEPIDGIGTVVEIHFVGDASNPVITEAKIVWHAIEKEGKPVRLRVIGGRFWWPFGIHNDEWFSAVNRFHLISPAAAEVLPAHFNEVGIMAEGEVRAGRYTGLNYVLSVGNGVSSFNLPDNVRSTQFDSNGNRTVTGRLGFVFNKEVNLEIGFSGSTGDLRTGESNTFEVGDPRRYGADFSAYGPDAVLTYRGFGWRSYYYRSHENLANAAVSTLARDGLTVEPSYTFKTNNSVIPKLTVLGRYSFANEEFLNGTTYRSLQYGFGINASINDQFTFKAGYLMQDEERQQPKYDNNLLSFSLTAEF